MVPPLSRYEVDAAVFMATTWLAASTSAPPESPAWIGALVSINPVSCSDAPLPSSTAVIDWLRAVTLPRATLGVPPVPPALPSAVTALPTRTAAELPNGTVARPDAQRNRRTATSAERSYPTTLAAYVLWLPTSVT